KKNGEYGVEVLTRWPDQCNIEQRFKLIEELGGLPAFTEKLFTKLRSYVPKLKYNVDFVSVNISPSCLSSNKFIAFSNDLFAVCQEQDIVIWLEITEHDRYPKGRQLSQLKNNLDYCRRPFVKIAMDDFGSGFNNIETVSLLRPDILKLDRSLLKLRKNTSIWADILTLKNRYNLSLVVEGVETEAELSFARKYGASYAQGYFIQKPTAMCSLERQHSTWC
uniref:EAL domain-containing protein n=1 Tax=Vibrio campbellii TaxID=680 RepID=UPI00068091C3